MLNSQIPPENAFDFWIGSWKARWNDSIKGTNKITKILNDKAVEENFAFNDGTFKGKSWSVYNYNLKEWQQTWVDNTGAYLVFTGGHEGDKVILTMSGQKTKNGKPLLMRMVFFNIKKDSFDWDWQSSEDAKEWKSTWFIRYEREK